MNTLTKQTTSPRKSAASAVTAREYYDNTPDDISTVVWRTIVDVDTALGGLTARHR